MIMNKRGEFFLYRGVIYRIGDRIIATEESEYAGLNGVILEIRDGADKDTENDTPDIYCSFEKPVLPSDIEKLEKRFCEQEMYLEEGVLESVIMAPKMIWVYEPFQSSIRVYVVTEEWSADSGQGKTTQVYASLWEAKAHVNRILAEEMENGCLSDWIDKSDYRTETSELSYEGWIDSHYMEFHYRISITELEMFLTPEVIHSVGLIYEQNDRFRDFALKAAECEKAKQLSQQEYQRFLAYPHIPDMIQNNLGTCYWESYWDAVSETVNILLHEYFKMKTHSQTENAE